MGCSGGYSQNIQNLTLSNVAVNINNTIDEWITDVQKEDNWILESDHNGKVVNTVTKTSVRN